VNMMQKDVQLALDLGRQLDVPLPTTAATNEWLTAARALGLAEKDFAAVFHALARVSESSRDRPPAAPLPADASDSPLRGARQRSLHARPHAGPWHIFISVRRRWPSASARRLRRDDYITSTHRGHGHCLAKAPRRI